MTITGTTRTYAHIGYPIHHVRTPALYNRLLGERDIDVVVVPVEVAPEDLASMAPAFRAWRTLAGIGVTIPHKEAMVHLVDQLTPMAELCGATNVIRRDSDGTLVGGQFDGIGLVQSLLQANHRLKGAKVLMSGAGGTARAVAFALAQAGVGTLVITNRTRDKAAVIAAQVRQAFPACDAVLHGGEEEFDVVVNTTSLGMKPGDSLPVDPAVLRPGVVVADAVMAPPETALLKLAAERGCTPHPGLLMLQAQFESTLEFLGLVER
ncbi:shikimate dehydrogenase family protein [Pedococcus sp. 5OH_020]|uniref:shikimate dehydrogenase family protein n=1 Tax=Pedococcus sp. 5OH_020 TaxID=2989814 RepID=UPI0022E9FF3D|nr:shikimate dehydrogenase [Pedococcus sp. 5OH_020]